MLAARLASFVDLRDATPGSAARLASFVDLRDETPGSAARLASFVVVGVALSLDVISGFDDAAHSIATVVSTRVLDITPIRQD